jgi:hypothetical protein
VSNQYSRGWRSRDQKRAEAYKLYGWPNNPRYWDSRYARWHVEPEPEPDIYLLRTQTASNLLIGPEAHNLGGFSFGYVTSRSIKGNLRWHRLFLPALAKKEA